MIRSNLAVLLAERNLKITKVSKDTGISRTTLTTLSNNNSQGIQFDTLNTLCMYLKIEPNQLFSYLPFDISVDTLIPHMSEDNSGHVNIDYLKIELAIEESNKLQYLSLRGFMPNGFEIDLNRLEITIELANPYDGDIEERNKLIAKSLSCLTPSFISDLERDIVSHIGNYFLGDFEAWKDSDIRFYWNIDF